MCSEIKLLMFAVLYAFHVVQLGIIKGSSKLDCAHGAEFKGAMRKIVDH